MDVSLGVIIGHVVVYLAAIFILKYLYFDPVLKVLKRREELTAGRESSTAELKQKIQEFTDQYQGEIRSLKSQLDEDRQKTINEVQQESDDLIQRVRTENETQMNEHQKKLDAQLEDIRERLPDLGSRLGDEIAEAVMNSKVVRGS